MKTRPSTELEPGAVDVAELQRLLGPAVLLRWPSGSKGLPKLWGHLRLADMTPDYLARLADGNVGVALGEVSGGLVAIDADDEQFASAFAEANLGLADTLQTHGARGRVWWIRLSGSYHYRTVELKDGRGKHLGEFRSGGSQSIVAGIHPSGVQYSFPVQQPVKAEVFESIVWPDMVANPPGISGNVTQAVCVAVSLCRCVTLRDTYPLIEACAVKAVHSSNAELWTLARGVRAIEANEGRKLTRPELEGIFKDWYRASLKFLRLEQGESGYWLEFLEVNARAQTPLGESAVIKEAWHLSGQPPVPPAALRFDGDIRRLVAFCHHLQSLAGKGTFFLSCRTVQKMFGVVSHVQPARWLKGLVADGTLELIKFGVRPLASEYRLAAAKDSKVYV